jgi:hypothetical protein
MESVMRIESRFFKSTAVLCAAATAALMVAGTQPASAGASTGTWRYYPGGVYGGGYGGGYRGHHGGYGYGGYRGAGYGGPGYGYNPYYSARPSYGYGYGSGYGYGYEQPYYHHHSDPGAAVAAGVMGLAAGAILGGALSQRSHHTVSCANYRSYNPRTGTFVGRNGVRYACR